MRPKRRPHSVCNRTPRYLLSTCDHHHRAPSTHKHKIPLPSELLPKAPYLSLQGLQAFNIPSRMRSQDISVALALVLSLATLAHGVRMGNSPQLGVEETLNVPDMIHSRQPIIGESGRSLLFSSGPSTAMPILPPSCSTYEWQGTCGAFSKKTDRWRTSYGRERCCSRTFDGCCEVDGGAVAGLVIGVFVFVAIVVFLSVWACKRNACCCYNKPVPPVAVAAVPMAPMGYVTAGGTAV